MMNRIFAILVYVITICGIAKAQPHYFQRSLGATNFSGSNDIVNSIFQTRDGGYIVCGSTGSYGAGSNDGFLAKFDSMGIQSWAKTYGTSNFEATFIVIITSDSGYLFAGSVFDSTQANKDILVIKTDMNGAVQWTKKYGGIASESSSRLLRIQQTSDLGYIITGTTKGYDTLTTDNIFLIKTDASGDTLWTRVFTAPAYDQALCVRQTFEGGYIISGRTTSYGGGQLDALLIKTDSAGFIEWANAYGGQEGEEGMSVKQTADSGYIVAGSTYSFGASSNNPDFYIFKTDEIGIQQWSKTYGETSIEASYNILPTFDGGYASVGYTESYLSPALIAPGNPTPQGGDSANIMFVKIDSIGGLQWAKVYGGIRLDEAYGLSQARDSGYLIAATTRSFGSDSTDNGYIIHTDVNGDINCYARSVNVQVKDSILSTTPATFTYTWGMSYSNYTLTEAPFTLQDNLLCITVGLNDDQSKNPLINIYPNPVTDKCVIDALGFTNAELFVYDMMGRMMLQQRFNSTSQLNTTSFVTGIYLVEIKDEQGKCVKGKILKSEN